LLKTGYPVIMDAGLPLKRVKQALTYLHDGGFLSSALTSSMTARLLSFNPDARVFGYWRATFEWMEQGTIEMRSIYKALPTINHMDASKRSDLVRLMPDIAMLFLVIGYAAIVAFDFLHSFRAQRLAQNKVEAHNREVDARLLAIRREAEKSDPDGRGGRAPLAGPPRKYATRASVFWLSFEGLQVAIMLISVVALFVYGVGLVKANPFGARVPVYDADLFAPARMFQLAKVPGRVADDAGRLLRPSAGQPQRWRLADDTAPLALTAEVYAHAETMYAVYTLYTSLQGISLMLLIIRLINLISFQPRLSVISGTLARMLPDLANFAVNLVAMALMFVMLLAVAFGGRVGPVHSFEESARTVFQYLVLSDDQGAMGSIADARVSSPWTDKVMAGLVYATAPIFFLFILACFLMAFIAWPYTELKAAVEGEPGVPEDVVKNIHWWLQTRLGAPSNRRIARLVDEMLNKREGQIWRRLSSRISSLGTGMGMRIKSFVKPVAPRTTRSVVVRTAEGNITRLPEQAAPAGPAG